ncbi:lipoyl synthase 1, chloroplastic-like [Curcuma longa]|uniref:lipoyl synthase 1, chloroplastic-like n=1 Tax=Curcuma longa TaxID=136217 RepID=UPI003D9E9B8C
MPICSAKPRSKNSRNLRVFVRSEAVDASKRAEAMLSESLPAAAFGGPYPGGMGLHTGREPKVKKPERLRQRAPQREKYGLLQESLSELKLNTVCAEAQCPTSESVGKEGEELVVKVMALQHPQLCF